MTVRRTIGEALAKAARGFRRRGIDEDRLDAEVLLGRVLQLGRAALYARVAEPLPGAARPPWARMVRARRRRVPVAYLTGSRGFYDIELQVGPGVLVPRPESELLVEVARGWVRAHGSAARVLDVGTGSGNLAITIARQLPGSLVIGVDCSCDALLWARRNVLGHVGCGVHLIAARAQTLTRLLPARSFDLVVSNPPYVARADLARCEELAYEPEIALCGEDEFPAIYVTLARAAAVLLRPGGLLAVEIGCDQERVVGEILRPLFVEVAEVRDLAGIVRVVIGKNLRASM